MKKKSGVSRHLPALGAAMGFDALCLGFVTVFVLFFRKKHVKKTKSQKKKLKNSKKNSE